MALLLLRELPIICPLKPLSITCPIAQSITTRTVSPLYLKELTIPPTLSGRIYPMNFISLESNCPSLFTSSNMASPACFFLPCALGSLGALAASSSV